MTQSESFSVRTDIVAELKKPAQSESGDTFTSDEAETITEDREELLERLARIQAEFENARKRMAREQHEFRDIALSDALSPLLPVLDSFERALRTPVSTLGEFRHGINLIARQLRDVLRKLGLQTIPARGERFDPNLHEASGIVRTKAVAEGQVLEEVQRGYKLGDRVLRPARVVIAQPSEE